MTVEYLIEQVIQRAIQYGQEAAYDACGETVLNDPTTIKAQEDLMLARWHLINLVCRGIQPPKHFDVIEAAWVDVTPPIEERGRG